MKTKTTLFKGSNAYLTIRQLAEDLGVTERTVRNWITSKHLPAKRIGGVVRILESDLRRTIKPSR